MVSCVICNKNTTKFLALGNVALANSFLKNDEFESEKKYPLDVCFCENCYHVQLDEFIPPEILFKNYLYVSATSETLREHFSELAEDVLENLPKNSDLLIIDIGSNDGTLLKQFKARGATVLGVEPATNIAKTAEKAGIDTWNDFFNENTARKIAQKKGKAKAITGTNVFAHQPNYTTFMKGISTLLDNDGIFVIEVPYLPNLLDELEFDTIYHEHVSYFGLQPLETLYNKFGLEIFEVKKRNIHGGSIRVFARKGNVKLSKDNEFLKLEEKMNLNSVNTFNDFAKQVNEIRRKLIMLLQELKNNNKKIAGYGAAAKANTLLSYCDIDSKILDFIADKNTLKQGLYTPGTHIPVVSPIEISKNPPDYLLILAWNFADEIMKQQNEFKKSGGKFIIPLPVPKII